MPAKAQRIQTVGGRREVRDAGGVRSPCSGVQQGAAWASRNSVRKPGESCKEYERTMITTMRGMSSAWKCSARQ